MTEVAAVDAGPGVVRQKAFKPLGFLPPDLQKWIGWAVKGSLAVFTHNFYDLALFGHPMEFMPNILTEEGRAGLAGYFGKEEVKGFYTSKLGGDAANRIMNMGGASDDARKDSWGDYLTRKIIPGALYCALLGGIYGTVFPAALTSYIVTTAITDTVYKLMGEKLLGLPHIKS